MPSKKRKSKNSPLALILILTAVLIIGLGVFLGLRYSGRLKAFFLPLKYTEELKAAADRYGLDRRLVAAVVYTESGFDKDAVSVDGAEGLMQLLPSTAEWIASFRRLEYEEGSLFEPEVNLDYGCWLLSYLISRYDGNVRYALIAYNAGVGRLDGWLETNVDEKGELKDIPYAETRRYVEIITELIPEYGNRYEKELMDK